MPMVLVYGIPEYFSSKKLEEFSNELREAVEDNPALGLKSSQVFVFFPRDMLQKGLGEEIVVWVQGLFNYPSRAKEVLDKYAETMGNIAKKFFPDASVIECFVDPFKIFEVGSLMELQQGFWSST